jgi:predicted dehydrogenase
MLRVGVIGYGYWGPNLARNFSLHPNYKLVRIAEIDADRRAAARQAFPDAGIITDARLLCSDPEIDVVVVATPVFTHHEFARQALMNGKHVWVEKPMTSTSDQAKELVDLADSRDLVLMVDHTFLFTGPVQTMKSLIDRDELGSLYYYDSIRINLGIFQHDINVIWDLAPHDFSIMDYLLGPTARAVCAHGRGHYDTGLEDVAYVSVFYDNNLIAHFHLNWLSPVKMRRTLVGGSKKMLAWDDMNQEESLKIYNKGMDVKTREGMYKVLATPRFGDMYAPVVPNIEALKTAVNYFNQCIVAGERPHNDGLAGLRVVKMLEATDRSLERDGRVIELEDAWVAK